MPYADRENPAVMRWHVKLAVIGSRTFQDYEWLEQCLLKAFCVSDVEAVVSGGARGADA